MKTLKIVEKLVNLSPRQFEREVMTKNYIVKTLKKVGIECNLQGFRVSVPFYGKFYLKADGRKIECLSTSFKSGKITGDARIISSLDFLYESKGEANINFNPHCDCISLANYYDSPSLAVSKKDIASIKNAKSIQGLVTVARKTYMSCNIIAGNAIDPKNIYFAHYDCFFDGAIDNASGVAVCMSVILENRGVLSNNLFVFCGAEELSFDKPDYWGKCFRVFEVKSKRIMKNAKKIIVVDCVGTAKPEIKNDKETVFPFFAKRENEKNKIAVITSVEKKPERFMQVYHSKNDCIGGVSEKYLQMAIKKCLSLTK